MPRNPRVFGSFCWLVNHGESTSAFRGSFIPFALIHTDTVYCNYTIIYCIIYSYIVSLEGQSLYSSSSHHKSWQYIVAGCNSDVHSLPGLQAVSAWCWFVLCEGPPDGFSMWCVRPGAIQHRSSWNAFWANP